jgi:ParB family chromosome partitioning protein
MELRHIDYGKLSVSPLNMRFGTVPDVSDILPTIRRRGILQPLLVRQNGSPDSFEVVAGARRLTAAGIIVAEAGDIEPLPCAIMEEGDDAAALEASLIENTARLDPDPMRQYETFARLAEQGRPVGDIADTFGITPRQVGQRLALGNLIPQIRELYVAEELDAETLRHLTLATPKQQKAWVKLHKAGNAPTGRGLKQWLFGGSVPTANAIFPLDIYKGRIVADLFGEESYFADVARFWELQNAAIAARVEALTADGWSAIDVLEPGMGFHAWNYEKRPRETGGKLVLSVSAQGEVEEHEGWITHDEARRLRRAEDKASGDKQPAPERAEVTKALSNYIDLHRHALARMTVLDAAPGVLLRLAVAQIVAGSALWTVRADEQRANSEAITKSLSALPAEQAFAEKRTALLTMLGAPDYHRNIVRHYGSAEDSVEVFALLLTLDDAAIWELFAFVLAESLEAGSPLVDAIGMHQGLDLKDRWTPDETFFELIRDREVANRMVAEVAGKTVANGNATEKVRTQKAIIRDCLAGENNRKKVEDWVPRYMQFPALAYTKRGGVPAVAASARAKKAFADHRPGT